MFGKYITATATDGVTLASTAMEYYSKDYLGSIIAITDGTGAVTQRLSYDVWGKRRYPNGAADPNGLLNNPDMYHGFTGHEMLDSVGLIHMNGRLYDPVMARFVSADFLIQSPDNLQSYNRYSYGWNNPLSGTDPSGQSILGDVLGGVGNAIGGIFHGAQSAWKEVWHNPVFQAANVIAAGVGCGPQCASAYVAMYTVSQGGSVGDAAKAAAITYATAMAFDAVGTATGGHNPGADYFGSAKYYANLAGHAVVGCASSAASGGDCGSGAMGAGFSAAATPFAIGMGRDGGTIASAIIGGTASVLGGGRFANGAVTAAFGYLYNSQKLFNTNGEDSLSNRTGPTDQSGRTGRTGSAIEEGTDNPRFKDKIQVKIGDALWKGVTGLPGLVSRNPLTIAMPFALHMEGLNSGEDEAVARMRALYKSK